MKCNFLSSDYFGIVLKKAYFKKKKNINIKKNITVIKANGERERYDENKIRRSLLRAGAEGETVDSIIEKTRAKIYADIPTQKLYHIVFSQLKRKHQNTAGKYHLKQAIYELGPSGYPFEKYIGEVLIHDGYKVQTGQMIKGSCVTHEVDVVALNSENHFMIECKFHHKGGMLCNVKVPLYIQARFLDVKREWEKLEKHDLKLHKGWVVTNTRFSADAIQYGNCMGLFLWGWDYPEGNGLREKIDALKLYPVTCLQSITKEEKLKLLDQQIILCKSICNRIDVLKKIGINNSRIPEIIQEVKNICSKS